MDKNAFARITPGKTSSAMASAMMGDPSSKKKTDAGTEIWVWSYDESKSIDGQFLIIRDSDVTTISQRASVEIKDGVVVDKWYSGRE